MHSKGEAMKVIDNLKAIPNGQKFRYAMMIAACAAFLAPLLLIPSLFDNPDLCGRLCMRRFYLYWPGMDWSDLSTQVKVSLYGVIALALILSTTFFFGRIWCSYVCPVGAFPELVSRSINDRWKIEYRALPQVPLRYGYFITFVVLMPLLGISACTICNFITVPRVFEALAGGFMGLAFVFSAVGLVNLGLLFLLGFFAKKGRAYCMFLCPIGAIDALVNRFGARFKFTRRVRVERDRCTGCNACARACMVGAIKMVDRIAVVDQLACMSCHECADVCDWGAIDWQTEPENNQNPKRKKKGVDFHPQPVWTAMHFVPKKPEATGLRAVSWQRVFLGVIFSLAALFVAATSAFAAERQPDPDGCLACHGLAGLDYLDKDGVRRSAYIDPSHYLGSLHGSVPCTDCHREVREYPHDAKATAVDCAGSCHVKEPSKGEAYSHKAVTKEYHTSVHGKGASKGFTGGNRLREATADANPSCRTCHQNTAYISEDMMPRFREAFAHQDKECGKCHQGEVWRDQFSGHILRRFVGGRWDKAGANEMCKNCHGDTARMQKVEREDPATHAKAPAPPRFTLASKSYEMTLHGRLIRSGVEQGASCNECHAPTGLKHGVRRSDDPASSTHEHNLAQTCSQEGCHGFAGNPLNGGFLKTDLHDLDFIPPQPGIAPLNLPRFESNWVSIGVGMLLLAAFLAGGSLRWWFFAPKKGEIGTVLGEEAFQVKMIGRRPKGVNKKKETPAPKPAKSEPAPSDAAAPAAAEEATRAA